MGSLSRIAVFLVLLFHSPAFSQLRNNSEYTHDGINLEKTYFALSDTGAAEYGWASEWTNASVDFYAEKSAMFLWHFKDGSKFYSLQQKEIGEIGKNSGYLLTGKSQALEDIHRKSVQPLTRENYPVKIELWIGKIDDSAGFAPEILGAALCLDSKAKTLEHNRTYHFSSCD